MAQEVHEGREGHQALAQLHGEGQTWDEVPVWVREGDGDAVKIMEARHADV